MRMNAGDDLHESRLARTVFADNPKNDTWVECEGSIDQRWNSAKASWTPLLLEVTTQPAS